MFTRAGASVGWGGVHLGCWFAIEARSTPPRPTSAVHMVSLASNFQTDLCAAWAGTISERRSEVRVNARHRTPGKRAHAGGARSP